MRRALSYAVDRTGLVENVTKGGQEPARWFCRPGMAGCPTMEAIPIAGIGSDPARWLPKSCDAYLDDEGYTTVDEIPELILMHNTSEGHKRIAEAISEMWKETLGIQPTVTNQEWKVYLTTFRKIPPTSGAWAGAWTTPTPTTGPAKCSPSVGTEEDGDPVAQRGIHRQLLEEAALERDLDTAAADMYAEAETILCKEDAAIIPLYWYTMVNVTKPYVNRTYSQHGHEALEKWSLDR